MSDSGKTAATELFGVLAQNIGHGDQPADRSVIIASIRAIPLGDIDKYRVNMETFTPTFTQRGEITVVREGEDGYADASNPIDFVIEYLLKDGYHDIQWFVKELLAA